MCRWARILSIHALSLTIWCRRNWVTGTGWAELANGGQPLVLFMIAVWLKESTFWYSPTHSSLRELSSQALHNLTALDPQYMMERGKNVVASLGGLLFVLRFLVCSFPSFCLCYPSTHLSSPVLPKTLCNVTCPDLCLRHGSLYTLAEITFALYTHASKNDRWDGLLLAAVVVTVEQLCWF